MIVGVIGSGSIGPDLAYAFLTTLGRVKGARVLLVDVKQQALDAGVARIRGYMQQAMERGKLKPKAAQAMEQLLSPSTSLDELAPCELVIEATHEDLALKQQVLAQLEDVIRDDCLVGFTTSSLTRHSLVREARHPERCFVTHPFFPAWRTLPVELVRSEDPELSARMENTLRLLGKVTVPVADVACFAANDLFCSLCAEAMRIVEQGLATVAQVDQVADEVLGGGGPFKVMDRTGGTPLNLHCLAQLKLHHDSDWFTPPAALAAQGDRPWRPKNAPAAPPCDAATSAAIRDRLLAVVLGRALGVVEAGTMDPSDLNFISQLALGFKRGVLQLARDLGAPRVRELCQGYAKEHPGFPVAQSITEGQLPAYYDNICVERDLDLATVTVRRPKVKNALNNQTLDELDAAFAELGADEAIAGVVLTSVDGALAGADIKELAALPSQQAAVQQCLRGQAVVARIAALNKPVVAAVDGPVLGGGCELSMGCHARVAGPNLMMGQPEVNLGVIPGYGGTQRLPRLIGLERALDLLRSGRPTFAKDACEWGWAHDAPERDPISAAKALIRQHLAGELTLAPVSNEPMTVPAELPQVDIGAHSRKIDEILLQVVRDGLHKPLPDGLRLEAEGFGRCQQTQDFAIGMKNFIENGPRAQAEFVHA